MKKAFLGVILVLLSSNALGQPLDQAASNNSNESDSASKALTDKEVNAVITETAHGYSASDTQYFYSWHAVIHGSFTSSDYSVVVTSPEGYMVGPAPISYFQGEDTVAGTVTWDITGWFGSTTTYYDRFGGDKDAVLHVVRLSDNSIVYLQCIYPLNCKEAQLNKIVSPVGAGRIDVSPVKKDNIYATGTKVNLLAVPNSGVNFLRWDGVDSSNGINASITMVSNKTVTANFAAVNHAPTANGGPDIDTLVGASVTLDGRGSMDVDGDPLTYAWVLVTRPPRSTAVFQGANSVSPLITPDIAGGYVATLTVSDGKLSSTVYVTIVARDINTAADLYNRFSVADTDGNFSLTPSEIKAAGLNISNALFSEIDKNGDGVISFAEAEEIGCPECQSQSCLGSGKTLVKRMYGDLLLLASAGILMLALGNTRRYLWKD